MKITKKITLLYGGIFSLSLIAISLIVMVNASALQQDALRRQLLKTAENIEAYLQNDNEMSEDVLSTLLDNKYVEATVINMKTHEFYHSSVGEPPPFMMNSIDNQGSTPQMQGMPENEQAMQNGPLHPQKLLEKGYKISQRKPNKFDSKEYVIEGKPGQSFILMERKITTHLGEFVIQTYKMLTQDKFYIESFGIRMFIIDILGILAACFIGWYISRIMLKPVEEIRQTAERISIEDLSQRIASDGPDDEMKELTETFNSMIARLEVAFKKQNQFISDASHELRTPIAVIQGYANLINRWGKSDPIVLQESIDSIRAETEHMSELIKKLLLLAKVDQEKLHVNKVPMNLKESVQEVIKEIDLLDVHKTIIFEEQDNPMIYGDGDLIKQLLWIHTENALKYTPDGGTILYRICQKDKMAYISIQDNGAGMREEDIPFIFDRFYRVDKSRNKEIPGTGLGLSIAKWIVDCHNGEIKVESSLDGGTTFVNSFPIWEEKG